MPKEGSSKGRADTSTGQTVIVGADLFFTLASFYATFLFIKWLCG